MKERLSLQKNKRSIKIKNSSGNIIPKDPFSGEKAEVKAKVKKM